MKLIKSYLFIINPLLLVLLLFNTNNVYCNDPDKSQQIEKVESDEVTNLRSSNKNFNSDIEWSSLDFQSSENDNISSITNVYKCQPYRFLSLSEINEIIKSKDSNIILDKNVIIPTDSIWYIQLYYYNNKPLVQMRTEYIIYIYKFNPKTNTWIDSKINTNNTWKTYTISYYDEITNEIREEVVYRIKLNGISLSSSETEELLYCFYPQLEFDEDTIFPDFPIDQIFVIIKGFKRVEVKIFTNDKNTHEYSYNPETDKLTNKNKSALPNNTK